jgi:radical SAM protein with 4Fe4S-binding SPASM domain
LAQAKALGLRTVVFTSGVVYGEGDRVAASRAQLAALAPVLDRAVFSLYSLNGPVHDAVTRTAGSLELTLQAIRRTVEVGIRAELHFVPTRENYRDLPALVSAAHVLGVSTVRILRYVPQGRGYANQGQLGLARDQQKELRDLLRQAVAAQCVEVRIGSGFGYLVEDAPPCTAAVEELVVSASGRVYPCSGFSSFRGVGAIGDVQDMSLAEVWMNSPYLCAVRAMLAARETAGAPCDVGCLAQKAAASGKLTDAVPDPDALLLGTSVAIRQLGETRSPRRA